MLDKNKPMRVRHADQNEEYWDEQPLTEETDQTGPMGPTEPRRRKKGMKGMYISLFILVLLLAAGAWVYSVSHGGIDVATPAVPGELNLQVQDYSGYTRKDKYYTFLVVGTDASGLNTDTILLASYDTVGQKINLLQVPRDSMLEAEERDNKRVNASFAIGGVEQLESDLEGFLGIPIDRYVVVSITAFRNIVDAVGGVEVNVPQDMQYNDPYQDLTIDLKAGVQVLDGAKAEGFVRFRHDYADADIGRLKTQKAFISAFMKKLMSLKTALHIPDLVNAVMENLDTNLSASDMLFLASNAINMNAEDIHFFTLTGENYRDVYSYYAIYKNETMEMINTNFNPFTKPLPADMFHILEFERQENNEVDTEGSNLDEAANTELSVLMGTSAADNQTANPENSPNHYTTAEDQNSELIGSKLPTPTTLPKQESTQTSTTEKEPAANETPKAMVAGEGAKESGAPMKEVFETDKVKVELINSTKDKAIMETVKSRLESLGYEVVWEDTANNIEYSRTTIINRGETDYAGGMERYYPGSTVLTDHNEKEADVTFIIGTDLLK